MLNPLFLIVEGGGKTSLMEEWGKNDSSPEYKVGKCQVDGGGKGSDEGLTN